MVSGQAPESVVNALPCKSYKKLETTQCSADMEQYIFSSRYIFFFFRWNDIHVWEQHSVLFFIPALYLVQIELLTMFTSSLYLVQQVLQVVALVRAARLRAGRRSEDGGRRQARWSSSEMSVIMLNGNGADVAKQCVLAKRISITCLRPCHACVCAAEPCLDHVQEDGCPQGPDSWRLAACGRGSPPSASTRPCALILLCCAWQQSGGGWRGICEAAADGRGAAADGGGAVAAGEDGGRQGRTDDGEGGWRTTSALQLCDYELQGQGWRRIQSVRCFL